MSTAAAPALARASEAFRQGRFAHAAELAQDAARAQPGDASTLRLLATSRFLEGRPYDALAAWNAVGEPAVDLIRADGLMRLRPRPLEEFLGLEPGRLLTPARLRLAERRLFLVPAIAAGRVGFEPAPGGRANLDVALLERKARPDLRAVFLDAAVRAVSEQVVGAEATLVASGGETLRLLGQWHPERSRVAISAAAVRPLGLPAVTTVGLLLDRQAYAAPPASTYRERRRRASLSFENWLTSSLRGSVELAADSWSDAPGAFALATRFEQRLAGDRLAVLGQAGGWWSRQRPFYVLALRVRARTDEGRRTVGQLEVGHDAANANAPLALWPGAGTGAGRAGLLRAHPLLRHGIVDGAAFGRALTTGSVEVQTSVRRVGPLRLAVATFVDFANVARTAGGPGRGGFYLDLGAGLRLRLPGRGSALRLDVAVPSEGGHPRVCAGWQASGW
jgi:hypothetical protein